VITLVLGLALFLGVHCIPALTDVKRRLVARIGVAPYKIGFTVLSFGGLALIVVGYGSLRSSDANVVLWDPPEWAAAVAYALILPAMIFIVASNIPSRIRTVLKHPMLVGIKTWALAHLIANGDLASALLFGSFLAYAVFDRISLQRRGAMGPLADKQGPAMNDAIVVTLGIALYLLLMFGGHQWLVGKPLLN
jgi:uncharacterized membrane protein